MGRPILNRCCCWSNTKDGSLAVGWMYMILSLLSLISVSISLANFDNVQEMVISLMQRPENEIPQEQIDIAENIMSIFHGSLIFELVVTVLYVLVCGLLLYGLHSDKRMFLMPWIVWTSFSLFCSLIILIIVTVVFIPAIGWPVIIGTLVGLGLIAFFIYCLLCVISQYQKYREDGAANTENMTKLY